MSVAVGTPTSLSVVKSVPTFVRLHVDDRRRAGDRDRFLQRRDLHLAVDGENLTEAEHDVAALERLESGELEGQLVLTRWQRRDRVLAVGFRDDRRRTPCSEAATSPSPSRRAAPRSASRLPCLSSDPDRSEPNAGAAATRTRNNKPNARQENLMNILLQRRHQQDGSLAPCCRLRSGDSLDCRTTVRGGQSTKSFETGGVIRVTREARTKKTGGAGAATSRQQTPPQESNCIWVWWVRWVWSATCRPDLPALPALTRPRR